MDSGVASADAGMDVSDTDATNQVNWFAQLLSFRYSLVLEKRMLCDKRLDERCVDGLVAHIGGFDEHPDAELVDGSWPAL